MAQLKAFLSTRRAYEFKQDDIRLTTLSVRGVIEAIKASFGFEFAEIGAPPGIFGDVHATNPPGLIFGLGVTPFPEQGTVVRSLTIDSRRVVIDVAGPSTVIPDTFDRLKELVNGIRASDGMAPFGEHVSHLDYSELVIHSSSIIDAFLRPQLTSIVADSISRGQQQYDLVSAVRFRTQTKGIEFPGSSDGDLAMMRLEIRAGTKPSDGMVFSGAPLDTDAHLELLKRIESAAGSV